MRVTVERCTEDPEEMVLRAARNDYKSEWVGDTTDTGLLDEVRKDGESDDEALERFIVRTLLHKGHYGPFEHPNITFSIEGVSRSLMAQLTRHRVGISFDIQSQRYVDFEGADVEELMVTPPSVTDVRAGNRDPTGRSAEDVLAEREGWDESDLAAAREEIYTYAMETSQWAYQQLRGLGVPPEDARFVFPNASKTNIVVTMNARTLLHVADMRAAADSQWEIRELTEDLLDRAEEWMPLTFGYYRSEMQNRKNRLAP